MCLAMTKVSKTRVLIVEDEPDIAGLMKHALERGGDIDVEIVGTGAAALKSVMEEPPGLVLLDLNLPFIDGLEVCRLLRGRASSAGIPIIMVTAGRAKRTGSRGWNWCGRLRHQAVQPAGARRTRTRGAAAAAANSDRSRTSVTSAGPWRSTSMPCRYGYRAHRSG